MSTSKKLGPDFGAPSGEDTRQRCGELRWTTTSDSHFAQTSTLFDHTNHPTHFQGVSFPVFEKP
ncbi:hypothetical protein X801_08353, partial [Opisthorchis viverrini]